jgi:hypothetical protein
MLSFSLPRWMLAVLVFCGTLALSGCAGEKLAPVSGKVTLKDSPLTAGQVTFVPDAAKGNKSTTSPAGPIGADGKYKLSTNGKEGAPLGWYKVTVSTDTPGMGMGMGGTPVDPKNPTLTPSQPPSTVKIDPKYKDAASTPVSVEVTATPSGGQYDVKIP